MISWQEFREHFEKIRAIVRNKKLIIVIGNTGAGKSTTIDLLKGVQLIQDEELGTLLPDPKVKQTVYCAIGQSETESCTVVPQVVAEEDNDIAYLDCPGFLHTDEKEAAFVASTVPFILSEASIYGILVVADYNGLLADKIANFKKLAENLKSLCHLEEFENDQWDDRIIFAFTKITEKEKYARNKILNVKAGLSLSNTITENNIYFIRSEAKPDVKPLRVALRSLGEKEPIPQEMFSIPVGEPKTITSAYALVNKIAAALESYNTQMVGSKVYSKQTLEFLGAIYQSILDVVKHFHKIEAKVVHLPSVDILGGRNIKIAFSQFYRHYNTTIWYSEEFPKNRIDELIGYIKEVKKLFGDIFNECDDQLKYFDELISTIEGFTPKSVIKQALFVSADHDKENNNERFSQLRHVQSELLENSSCDSAFTGYDISQTEDGALKERLETALKSHDNLNAFIGWLIRKHNKDAKDVSNLYRFSEWLKQMVDLEENPDTWSHRIDPNEVIFNHAESLLEKNKNYFEAVSKDTAFITKLFQDYYDALTAVQNRVDAIVTKYQTTNKTTLDANYQGGRNSAIAFNVLGSPSQFTHQFSGKFFNKITFALNGSVAKRLYHDQYIPSDADRELRLTGQPIVHFLTGKLPAQLLAAEYLGLVQFTSAKQTADVPHPNIPVERECGHATSVMSTVSDNWNRGGDGVTGPHGWAFFEGDPNWTIPISISAKIGSGTEQDIYQLTFSGTYEDISANATFWRRGDAHYADPGGGGGFLRVLAKQLAIHVRSKWEYYNVRFDMGDLKVALPDVTTWFKQKRKEIADTVKADSTYLQALFKLDMAVLKLKLFSFLIKNQPNPITLLMSTNITTEIDTCTADTEAPSLTPTIAAQLSSCNVAGKVSDFMKAEPSIVSKHPLNLIAIATNTVNAHRVWREMQRPLPSLKIMRPKKDVNIKKYVTEISEEEDSVEITHRNLTQMEVVNIAPRLRELPKLNLLNVSHSRIDNQKAWTILSGLTQLKITADFTLDISNNNLKDKNKEGYSEELRHLIQILILTHPIVEVNLSHTELGENFISDLALSLAKNPRLKKLHLLHVQPFDDKTALQLLAALYINDELTEFSINGASLSVMISDAIDFMMNHKAKFSSDIPKELNEARWDYFDRVLSQFLNTRKPLVTKKDKKRDIFPFEEKDNTATFSLKKEVKSIVEVIASEGAHVNKSANNEKTKAPTFSSSSSATASSKASNFATTQTMGNKEVNTRYWYEDNDINAILQARILEEIESNNVLRNLWNQRKIQVLAAVDGMNAGLLEMYLRQNRQAHPGESLLLIPYNCGRNHWIAIVLDFGSDNQLRSAMYANSLGIGDFDDLNQRLNFLYPNVQLQEKHLFTQRDGSSCGAYVIENLLLMAKNQNVPKKIPSNVEIRARHLSCLEDKRNDFYRPFYDRQRLNRTTVASLNEQLGFLQQNNDNPFNASQLKKIIDVSRTINRIADLEIRNRLWEAFQPREEYTHNKKLHLDHIRQAIIMIAEAKETQNEFDQNALQFLMQLIFNYEWKKGTAPQLDKENFWLEYSQIRAISEYRKKLEELSKEEETKIVRSVERQIHDDEKMAKDLQAQFDRECDQESKAKKPNNGEQFVQFENFKASQQQSSSTSQQTPVDPVSSSTVKEMTDRLSKLGVN